MFDFDYGDILNQDSIDFKSQEELKKYYEKKYRDGGYKNGYIVHGVNVSKLYHTQRIKRTIELLSLKKSDVILDLGCGAGELERRIYKNCKKVYALDVTREAFSNHNLSNVEFIECNIENLPLDDSMIDKVVSIETLEHVLEPKKVIEEAYRVLKSGGKFVLSYPFCNYTIVKKIELLLGLSKPIKISEHLTEWSPAMVEQTFQKFYLESIVAVDFDLGKLGNIKRINNWTARKITNLQLTLNFLPSNSKFRILKFRK